MLQEQPRVATGVGLTHEERSGAPMQRPGYVPLLIVSRRDNLGLLAPRHPAATDLGIEMDVHLILKQGSLVVRQCGQQLADLPYFGVILGIGRTDHGTRPTPDPPQTLEAATNS